MTHGCLRLFAVRKEQREVDAEVGRGDAGLGGRVDPGGGTAWHIAGVTSLDGLSFGHMGHPERAVDPEVRLAFFENGVRAVR